MTGADLLAAAAAFGEVVRSTIYAAIVIMLWEGWQRARPPKIARLIRNAAKALQPYRFRAKNGICVGCLAKSSGRPVRYCERCANRIIASPLAQEERFAWIASKVQSRI